MSNHCSKIQVEPYIEDPQRTYSNHQEERRNDKKEEKKEPLQKMIEEEDKKIVLKATNVIKVGGEIPTDKQSYTRKDNLKRIEFNTKIGKINEIDKYNRQIEHERRNTIQVGAYPKEPAYHPENHQQEEEKLESDTTKYKKKGSFYCKRNENTNNIVIGHEIITKIKAESPIKNPKIHITIPSPSRKTPNTHNQQSLNELLQIAIEEKQKVEDIKIYIYGIQDKIDVQQATIEEKREAIQTFEQNNEKHIPKKVACEMNHDPQTIHYDSDQNTIVYPTAIEKLSPNFNPTMETSYQTEETTEKSEETKEQKEIPIIDMNQSLGDTTELKIEEQQNERMKEEEMDEEEEEKKCDSIGETETEIVEGSSWYLIEDDDKNIFHYLAIYLHGEAIAYFTGQKSPIDDASILIMLQEQDQEGNTPLHYLFLTDDPSTDEQDRVKCCNALLHFGGKHDMPYNKEGYTPFQIAIECLRKNTFDLLKEHNADISQIYDRLDQKISEDPHVMDYFSIENNGTPNPYGFYKIETREAYLKNHPKLAAHEKAQRRKQKRRLKKWNSMLLQQKAVNSKRFKKRVRKGIPDPIRGLAWSYIIRKQSQLDFNPSLRLDSYSPNTIFYNNLLKGTSNHLKLIDMDVRRTMCNHQFFAIRYGSFQTRLFRILKAYSIYNPEVSYCQGMSSLVAILLLQVHHEVEVFELLVCLMNGKWELAQMYREGLPLLHELFYVHDQWLHQDFPILRHHLEKNNISTGMYATKWYMCLLIDILPYEAMLRVLDVYLLEGSKLIVSACRGFMKQLSKRLLLADFEEALQLLQHPEEVDVDISLLIRTSTQRGYKLREKQIQKYRKSYAEISKSKRHTI